MLSHSWKVAAEMPMCTYLQIDLLKQVFQFSFSLFPDDDLLKEISVYKYSSLTSSTDIQLLASLYRLVS